MAKIDRAIRHMRRHLSNEETILGCSLAVLDEPDAGTTEVIVAATSLQVVVAGRRGRVRLACPYDELADVRLSAGRLTTSLDLASPEQDLHVQSAQNAGGLEAVATLVRERQATNS